MEHRLFVEIVVILALSTVTLFLCNRARIPTIVGFLAAGFLAGPYGFALVKAKGEVETLAEIGVILLLFTIGIEFRLDTLLRLRRLVLGGGGIQITATTVGIALALWAIGFPADTALVGGFLASLSSTAIVLKTLQQRGETETLQGRFIIGVLVLQDLMIVPMLLVVPVLAGAMRVELAVFLPFLVKATAILGAVFIAAKWILPRVLHQITRARDPELFLLSVVALGFGIAYLTSYAGLSLALGAFLAGLILSESPYANYALGSLLPLRDLFISFFFVSVGMLFDVAILFEEPFLLLGGTLVLIAFKGLIASAAGVLLGLPLHTAFVAGIALAQIGEFSFVLGEVARSQGVLDEREFQVVIGVAFLSIMATPLLIGVAPGWAGTLQRLPWPARLRIGTLASEPRRSFHDHLVIIGFGLVGRHISEAAEATGIPYVALEANPETVRRQQKQGRPVYHADATQEEALRHASIRTARLVAVVTGEPTSTRRIVERVRSLSPTVHILARTRYFSELTELRNLGADDVIPEEYETSIEIFTRVLQHYLVPREEIIDFANSVRASSYEILRAPGGASRPLAGLDLVLSDLEVRIVRVQPGSGAEGRTLAELDFRRTYGILVLALRRGETKIQLPDGDERFQGGDEVVLLGLPDLLPFADSIFRAPVG